GIPPLSGFWPKVILFQETFKQENYVLLVSLIIASFVTLFVVIRIWSEAFWKESPKTITDEIDHFASFPLSGKIALIAPVIALTAVSLFIGLNANSVFKLAEKAAYEMKHPEIYINNVLNTKP